MADIGAGIVSFTLTSMAVACLTRSMRIMQRREWELNQIIPLSDHVNVIHIVKQNKTTWSVKSVDGRKLFEIKKSNNKWHLQSNKHQTLSTINCGFRDRYMVRHRILTADGSRLDSTPLNTTPNIIRWIPVYTYQGRSTRNLDYQFGTNLTLRWVGEKYLEIITRNHKVSRDGGINIHERVALLKSYDPNVGYTILFDYDKINLEILIATFFLTITK